MKTLETCLGSFALSCNSLNKSDNDQDIFRYKWYYSYANVEEKSLLLPTKKQLRSLYEAVRNARPITDSVVSPTKSFSRLTTSNYFGFSGAVFDSARSKHVEN